MCACNPMSAYVHTRDRVNVGVGVGVFVGLQSCCIILPLYE